MVRWLCRIEHLNRMQCLRVQISLRTTFYSYFLESSTIEQNMYQFIQSHSSDYLYKTSIKTDVATDKDNSHN